MPPNSSGADPLAPLTLWWRALRQIDPGLDFDTFAGLSAAPASLAVCAPGCDCRLRYALNRSALSGLEACGFRAVDLTHSDEQRARSVPRIGSALRRGTPIVWLGGNGGGIVVEMDGEERVRLLQWTPAPEIGARGEWEDRTEALGVVLAGPLIAVRRAAGPRGLRGQRNMRALLEWLAASFRPPSRGGCVTGGPFQPHAEGLAAYEIWRDAVQRQGPEQILARAAAWREARNSGTAFLRGLAGAGGSRFSNRLRRAAEWQEEERDLCWSRPSGAVDSATLEDAAGMAREAAHLIGEAVLLRVGLPPIVASTLLEPWSEPLDGVALSEMLYLSRTGIRPLRELAARRLGGADQPAASAALLQLLYDGDGRTASTALWSLLRNPTPRLANALLGAARHGSRLRSGLDYPFSIRLALEAAVLDERAAERMVEIRESLLAEDPDDRLAGDIETVLTARAEPQRQCGEGGA